MWKVCDIIMLGTRQGIHLAFCDYIVNKYVLKSQYTLISQSGNYTNWQVALNSVLSIALKQYVVREIGLS